MNHRRVGRLIVALPATARVIAALPAIARVIVALLAILTLLAACGGAGSGLTVPQVAPARVFALGAFQPSRPVLPKRPVTISFTVMQPNGQPLPNTRPGQGRTPAFT